MVDVKLGRIYLIRMLKSLSPYKMCIRDRIKIVYDLLKDKLNIAKITFTSGVNAATSEFETKNKIDRCPLCGIALNENGVCPKCGYKK